MSLKKLEARINELKADASRVENGKPDSVSWSDYLRDLSELLALAEIELQDPTELDLD